jgi:hypothetical protein
MPDQFSRDTETISLLPLHGGQLKAYWALRPHRFKALRCGRRFGKTDFARTWLNQGLVQGQECAWFAPHHTVWAEVFAAVVRDLAPIVQSSSKSKAVIRFTNGARLDFWSLENPIAGRSRRYHRVVIDEAAFGKDGDTAADGSLMGLWETAIKPTLYDYAGEALVCSNSAGKNPDNFFYNICTDPGFGFKEFHATTMDNPLLPKRLASESAEEWIRRRDQFQKELQKANAPLVFAQEYQAEFVDWSGVAFFSRDKLLQDGQPLPFPKHCDVVFAVIDTASKTGTDNDATAVTYFAFNLHGRGAPLLILDWDVVQIEGATLEHWLPKVFERLAELVEQCGARGGSPGAYIEDKNSGTILLQQAKRRDLLVTAIDSKLTQMGKDERAFSVSGYVHRERVKYTDYALNKLVKYKGKSRNHLVEQVESFRIGDKKSDREDDLLDTFCYGIALALGNNEGF